MDTKLECEVDAEATADMMDVEEKRYEGPSISSRPGLVHGSAREAVYAPTGALPVRGPPAALAGAV
jgi:hypothetical protein